MSANWRAQFGYTKYISIAARATRVALKEETRVKAEARTLSNMRYQDWESGKAGENTWLKTQQEQDHKPPTSV